MSTPKIEVLVVRHPDGGTALQLWLDGEPSDAWSVEYVDPGAGYQRSEWDEHTQEVAGLEQYSPAFRETAVQARNEWADSEFIQDDRDQDES